MTITQNTKTDVKKGYSVPITFTNVNRGTEAQPADDVVISDALEVPDVIWLFEKYTPNDSKDHGIWKDFEHYKVVSSPVQLPGRLEFALSGVYGQPDYKLPFGADSTPYVQYDGWYGIGGGLNSGLPLLYVEDVSGHFVSPPADLDSLVQRSLTSMLPLIKAELSIINSVLELRDFASLPRTFRQVSSLLKTPSLQIIKNKALTLRRAFRAAADSYLQAKFNILPLLSDITGIRTALSRTERRLNDFITRSGRVQHKHYAYVMQEGPPQTYDVHDGAAGYTSSLAPLATSIRSERFTYLSPTTFHAEIEYNYNYTQYQLEHARLLSLLDAVGDNLNPAIIWNAIPWSFVIDWVFGVSQWLSRQRIGTNMDPKINIHRYLWSVKRSRRIQVQRQASTPLYGFGGPPTVTSSTVPLPALNETAYRRVVSLPEAASIESSGLNFSEFSLAAALVIARKRQPTRRKSWAYNYVFPG